MIVTAPFPIEGRPAVLLAEGALSAREAKTAVCVAHYRPRDVVAVVDSTCAGRRVRDVAGMGGDVPVVASMDEALRARPAVAILGTAPTGGVLAGADRALVARCLEAGLDLVSGMHAFVADDRELMSLAASSGARVWDVRRATGPWSVASGRGCATGARVVATVGTDCGVGKMTATVELARAAHDAGLRSAWAATGQTGMMLRGRGVPIDAVVSDFAAGATEELVNHEGRDADVVFVEGQGSITHAGYAGVTLSLLYGSMPDALVLVHEPGRTLYKRSTHRIPPVADIITLYESLMRPWKNTRVVAIALNTSALDADAARRATEDIARATGLPASDVVRDGTQTALTAVRMAIKR